MRVASASGTVVSASSPLRVVGRAAKSPRRPRLTVRSGCAATKISNAAGADQDQEVDHERPRGAGLPSGRLAHTSARRKWAARTGGLVPASARAVVVRALVAAAVMPALRSSPPGDDVAAAQPSPSPQSSQPGARVPPPSNTGGFPSNSAGAASPRARVGGAPALDRATASTRLAPSASSSPVERPLLLREIQALAVPVPELRVAEGAPRTEDKEGENQDPGEGVHVAVGARHGETAAAARANTSTLM